jgi:uncharacterized membrane protein YfcA
MTTLDGPRARLGAENVSGRVPPFLGEVMIGLLAGFLSGLLGIGGGVVLVALMIMLLGLSTQAAVATSLAAMVFTLLAGVASFGLLNEIEWRPALLVLVPAVIGSMAGAWLHHRVSSAALEGFFAIFLFAVAIKLMVA